MKGKIALMKKTKTLRESTMVLPESISGFINNPDKYVYPFVIKEKNGKERTIITYNKFGNFGSSLRTAHETITRAFKTNFYQRNVHSFAYHENVRCSDALQSHMRSNIFIKLDIHHFFESITKEAFFSEYGEYFNCYWTTAISGLFYKDALSIGFVSSPVISDFYMRKFDRAIHKFLKDYPELHYSRYSDDILLSSELDDDESINKLFDYVKEQLKVYRLEINEKKTRKMKLNYESHNSISYLGLNISKSDSVNNKVTISKRYILFLLFLIKKQKGYTDHCYPLDNEIKSRIAYLAYNSPISYHRFQKKHTNIYGEPYSFMPKELEKRSVARVTNEIPNFDEYSKTFKINIHKKIAGPSKYGFVMNDAIEIEKYIGKDEEVVEIPYFVDSIGKEAFKHCTKIKKVILNKKLKNIDIDAFAYASSLEEIEFPNSLRCIDYGAFQWCPSLRAISIPSNIKNLGDYAFQNCFNLESIALSEGLETIGASTFRKTNITSIVLPQSLKQIGSSAFACCENLTSINLDKSKVEVIGSSAFENCVLIKEVILPNSLLKIEDKAFYGCNTLKRVYISSSVLEANGSAFMRCPNLASLEVGDGNKIYETRSDNSSLVSINDKTLSFTIKNTIDPDIKQIGAGLFMDSTIKSIVVPEGVTGIGPNAFKNAYLLKEIVLPSTLKTISFGAFYKCISLLEITIPEGVTAINGQAFYGCPRLRKVNLLNSVKFIGASAFEDDELLDIRLPENLVEIGPNAFKNCTSIKNLYIPASVKKIRKNAFLGLSRTLETINVDPLNVVFSSGNNANVLYNFKKATVLLGCKNSQIEQGIRTIYKYAFAHCDGLEKLVLPDTVSVIEEGAFIGCKDLKEIKLAIVSKIGKNAFADTTSLETIDLPNSLTELGDKAFYNSGLRSISLPNSLTKLGKSIVDNCLQLEEIRYPSTLDDSDIFMFKGCPSIKHLVVDSQNQKYDSRDNCDAIIAKGPNNKDSSIIRGSASTVIPYSVNQIYIGAFSEVDHLESIVIPDNIKFIGPNAFSNCSGLKKVEINADVTELSFKVFVNCSSLEEVVFNSPKLLPILESINKAAFENCEKLKHIKLPESVKTIEPSAFAKTGLEEIVLSPSIESIDTLAFNGCKSLKKVVFLNNAECSVFSEAFGDCTNLQVVDFSPRQIKLCSSGIFKNTAIQTMDIPVGCLEKGVLGSGTFMNCHHLETIKLPSDTKCIGAKAFKNADKLRHIIIPDGVTSIQSEAFMNCSSLESIALPDSLVFIDDGAFANCSNLKTINFPSSLKRISSCAFANCTNLIIPALPDQLETLGLCAFAGNKLIKEIILPKALLAFGNTAFIDTEIEHIKVDSENEIFKDEGKDVVCYINENGEKHLLLGCKNSIIPDDVNIIDKYAFYHISGLKKINLPISLTKIDDYAFQQCHDLEEMVLPENLLSIGDSAFKHCDNLKKVIFNEGLESIAQSAFEGVDVDEIVLPGSLKKLSSLPGYKKISINSKNETFLAIDNDAIYDKKLKALLCANKDVAIPAGCVTIKQGCFNGTKLHKAIIPEGVVSLYATYHDCGLIEEMHLPSTIKTVAFDQNTFIKKIYVDENNPYFTTNKEHTALLDITKEKVYYLCEEEKIPEGVRSTSPVVIKNNVKSFHIPSTLISLPYIAPIPFDGKVSVAKDNPVYEERQNAIVKRDTNTLVFLPDNTLIPDSVARLNASAFGPGLKSIFIPKNVNYIELNCFTSAPNLESIVVDKDNVIFDSRENCNAVIVTNKNIILAGCKNTVVPDGVRSGTIKKQSLFTGNDSFASIGYFVCKSIKDRAASSSVSFADDDLPF